MAPATFSGAIQRGSILDSDAAYYLARCSRPVVLLRSVRGAGKKVGGAAMSGGIYNGPDKPTDMVRLYMQPAVVALAKEIKTNLLQLYPEWGEHDDEFTSQ